MPWLSPRVTYEAMLAQELEAMRGADLLLHLNAYEVKQFTTRRAVFLHAAWLVQALAH